MAEHRLPESLGRRLWPRYPAREGIRVSCHEGTLGVGRDLAVALMDLSDTGIGLILSAPLLRGEVVEVGLRAPEGTEEIRRMGVIIWAAAAEGETCSVGILFSQRLGSDVLRDLCPLPNS